MAHFKVETVLDHASSLYYNELYYPAESKEPRTRTKPLYASIEQAQAEAKRITEAAFPDQPVQASREQ